MIKFLMGPPQAQSPRPCFIELSPPQAQISPKSIENKYRLIVIINTTFTHFAIFT